MRDRHVGRALALLHEKPAEPWTLDALGRSVGLSRSALHERFVHFIAQPPMQYLTQWRMQLAAKLLRESQMTVAAIALEVGYDSEAAFSRAFKRLTGQPPAASGGASQLRPLQRLRPTGRASAHRAGTAGSATACGRGT